jgi:hypothetical protein
VTYLLNTNVIFELRKMGDGKTDGWFGRASS